MKYADLCKTIAGLHNSIEVVMILSKNKLVASHLKSGGPVPEEEELRSMISHIETIIRTSKVTEDRFGRLEFIIIHYKYIDGLFFPLSEHDTLIIGIVQPYNYDSIVNKILAIITNQS
jgi:hypothetical protein